MIAPLAFILRHWRVLAVVVMAAALWMHGHSVGNARCELRHAEAQVASAKAAFQAAEIASRKEAARLEAEAAREALARELEDAANADPARNHDCLPADRVRRLNRQ